MKKTRNIFIALGIIFCAVSCGNGWLELEPSTAINTDEAVKTLKEVEFTMNGIYDIMRSSDLSADLYVLTARLLHILSVKRR